MKSGKVSTRKTSQKHKQKRHIKKEKSKDLRKGTPLNPKLTRALKLTTEAVRKKKTAQTLRRFIREDKNNPKISDEGISLVPKKYLAKDELDAAKIYERAKRIEKIVKKTKKVIKRKKKKE